MRTPFRMNISCASRRVLLQVHRSGDSGSPRVTGSTSFSSFDQASGYSTSTARRPPPLRRTFTRPSLRAPQRTSSRPLRTVLIAMPVARATAATPPQPIASASVPAHSRRARSSIVAFRRRHFLRTRSSTSTRSVDHADATLSIPFRIIFDRIVRVRALSGDGSSSGGGDGSMGDESNVCTPLPGCTSSTQCPATDGCNACTCEDGVWECTGYACPDGGNVACGTGPGPYVNGRPCTPPPQACSWPLGPGYECSFYFCSCSFGGEWFCSQEDCDGGAGLNVGEG